MESVDPKVFRTYDIRALVPDLVDETSVYFGKVGAADAYQAPLTLDGVEKIGRGLAEFFGEPTVVRIGTKPRPKPEKPKAKPPPAGATTTEPAGPPVLPRASASTPRP